MHGQNARRKTRVLTYGELVQTLGHVHCQPSCSLHLKYGYIKLGGDNHVFKSTFGHLKETFPETNSLKHRKDRFRPSFFGPWDPKQFA